MTDSVLRGADKLEDWLATFARDALATALFFDIDGTLAPLAPTPADAEVPRRVRAALAKLAPRLGLLAFVTGREVGDGREMVPVRNAVYVGNHGLQTLLPSGEIRIAREALPYVTAVEAATRRAKALNEHLPELYVEDKRLSVVVHYRQAADAHTAQRFIEDHVAGPARKDGLEVMAGKAAVEIRPPAPVTKGTAIGDLLREADYAGAFFAGDDLTDVTALKALRTWTTGAPARRGLGVAVVDAETPSAVRFEADVWLDGTSGVGTVLHRLVELTKPADESTDASAGASAGESAPLPTAP